MKTKSYTATEDEIQQLYQRYHRYLTPSKNKYIRYFFKTLDSVISIYTTNKVVIQYKYHNNDVASTNIERFTHAGSDESGSGDYFGPLTVCACIVEENDYGELQSLGISDSKKMSDEKILRVAPYLMKKLEHTVLILDNETYNIQQSNYNLNALKALLHNQAYLKLKHKPQRKIIDQFCDKQLYYKYLEGKEVVDLEFYTKAEDKFLAVACASVIARYAFLISIQKMNKLYNVSFPLGAGSEVDCFGKKLVEHYGDHVLYKVAKYHFITTEKILK